MLKVKFIFTLIFIFSVAISVLTHAQTTKPTTEAHDSRPQKEARVNYGEEVYRLINQKDEIVSVLRNGATVIVKRVPSPAVAVRAYIHTGGVYEGKWLGGGLSHLLEHLVAGGSNARRSEAENRNLLAEIGNNSNAYTTSDHTAYFINTTPPHMEQAVDLLTGWVLGASITPEEYRREYQVVQRELEKGRGEPGRQFWYLSQSNRYRISPARVPVIGYQEVIQGLSRDDVYEYYQLTYQPNNMVFSLAGDLEPEQMLQTVQKHVNEAPPGRAFSRDLPAEPPVLSPRTVVGTFPKIGQAKLELGFPTITLDHPDLYALDLLAAVLASGESSLLVEELRDKRRLVSGIDASSYTPTYVDGTFEVQMELDPEKIPAATEAVMELIERIKQEKIDPDRIERAKTQMRTARVRGLQTAEQIASSLASDFMSTGDPHFSDRYVQKIQEVTAEQMREAAGKYLDKSRLLTTVMLPAEHVGAGGLPKAEDLIRPVAPTTQEMTIEPASQVTKVELPNGTILLLKRITTTPLVVMNMYSIGGVTAEDAKTNGLGNLTMELLTRGTRTRSAQQIAQFFDSIGGSLNASCGNNTWSWSASCLKEDFEKTMEVYADVVHNPAFPENEIDQMKQRILARIEGQDADWSAQAMRYFKKTYFGPMDSPYQFLPIGTKENVEGFTAEQMRRWYDEEIIPSRRVLAIFGDIDEEQAKKLAMEYFGKGEERKSAEKSDLVDAAELIKPDVPVIEIQRVEIQKTQQPLAGVVIGFKSDSVIGEPANYPIDVADTMTSGYGYPTGYLHEILRGRGLVYVVHAQNWPGRSESLPGTFLVYAGCDPKKVNEVIDVILENIARVQGTAADMQEDWFERAKGLIVTSDAMDNETAGEQASTAALDELYGLGYNYHEQFPDRIQAVTLPRVRSVAARKLRDCVVTVSTPMPELVEAKPGRREYRSFPPVDLTPKGVQHDSQTGTAP